MLRSAADIMSCPPGIMELRCERGSGDRRGSTHCVWKLQGSGVLPTVAGFGSAACAVVSPSDLCSNQKSLEIPTAPCHTPRQVLSEVVTFPPRF